MKNGCSLCRVANHMDDHKKITFNKVVLLTKQCHLHARNCTWHKLQAVWPGCPCALPGLQLLHFVLPVALFTEPGAQLVQVADQEALLKVPRWHRGHT